MAKRIRREFPILIAPNISGFYINDVPKAFDSRSGTELDPEDTNDKLVIYERQVKDWFLNRATRLLRGSNNGFIVLMICLAYLEGIEQYKQGLSSNRRSGQFFRNSIQKIYPNTFLDEDLGHFYSEARCGLFHNGMVGGRIIIDNSYLSAIEFANDGNIKISPKRLLSDIKKDFNDYLSILKDEDNEIERENFSRMFSNI